MLAAEQRAPVEFHGKPVGSKQGLALTVVKTQAVQEDVSRQTPAESVEHHARTDFVLQRICHSHSRTMLHPRQVDEQQQQQYHDA